MKKKELKDQKLKFKNEERNLAPNRGQKEAFWAPKRAPNRTKNRVEKKARKKMREKGFEPRRVGTIIGPVSAQYRSSIGPVSAEEPAVGSGAPLTLSQSLILKFQS